MSEPLRIWALLGHRKGDNNQVLALLEALGLPFETRSLSYNRLRKVPKRILGHQLVSVVPSAREWIQPPWPDLVIGVGHRSVPVARHIRHATGGRAKLVQLGNPRIHPRNFDLVITMPQYGLAESENLVRLPLAMGSPQSIVAATPEEVGFLEALPRPHRLMVVGGPNKHWWVSPEGATLAARTLIERCDRDGGTLIVVGSPRTEPEVLDAVELVLAGSRHRIVRGRMPRYACLMHDADEIHVTADSVSMLSEAVYTGKPVGMIPIQQKNRVERHYAMTDLGLRKPPIPDLRAVWKSLNSAKLVGTTDAPRAGIFHDPTQTAVDALRRLLKHS
jgi:mitochondrial fission protein ELM1